MPYFELLLNLKPDIMMTTIKHNGFEIRKIGSFEYEVKRGRKAQRIGGLSNIESVKSLLDQVTDFREFFKRY